MTLPGNATVKIFPGRYNIHMMTGTSIHPNEWLPRLLDGLCRRCVLALLCMLMLAMPQPAMAGEDPLVSDLPTVRKQLRALILEGRAQPALQRIIALRKEHGDDGGLALLEGEAYYATDRFELAVEAFRNGLEIDPAKHGQLFNLGRALQQLGRDREALVEFEQMQQRPEAAHRTRGHFGAGLSWQSLGDIEQAMGLYQQALTLDPRFDRARYRLALLLLPAKPQEALSMLEQIIERDPLHHCGAYNRALALRNLGRVEDARQAMLRYQTILEGRSRIAMLKERWATEPSNFDLMMELGRTHGQLGALSEALRWFGKAGGERPEDPRPPLATIQTLLAAGKVAQARVLVGRLQGSEVASRAQALLEEFDARPVPSPPAPPPAPPSQDR